MSIRQSDSAAQTATSRPRIQTLSDMIFGLALSIGAIALLSQTPQDLGDLFTRVVAFGFSFLILSNIWLRYTRIMSFLPVETGRMTAVNIVLLFLVSIEPYLYNLLFLPTSGTSPTQLGLETTSASYAVDIALMNLVLAYLTHLLTVEEKKLVPGELLAKFRLSRNAFLISATAFLLSIFVPVEIAINGFPVRFLFWIGNAGSLAVFARKRRTTRSVT